MEDNKWMIVRKEKMSTKIKNYFKNIFSKMLNQGKKKKSKGLWPKKQETKKQEPEKIVKEKEVQPINKNTSIENKKHNIEQEKEVKVNKEITIEVAPTKRRPKEIVIEYENKPKKKQIVVEYEKKKKTQPKKENIEKNIQPKQEVKQQSNKPNVEKKVEKQRKTVTEQVPKKEINPQDTKIKEIRPKEIRTKEIKTTEVKPKEPELALKPVKQKKERKSFNIFQLFKDKERKKRKEILNRLRENKVDEYETISTKTKLSKGSIAVDDVDANELDPLIDLYRDSNNKILNRIKASQK